MKRTPEVFNSSIIVIGDFNPAIFTPDWLERNKLIGEDDANAIRESASEQLIVSHQVSTFSCKWFALQVVEKQFSLTSKDALSPAFKDLAAGMFQLLQHTPSTAVGLNFIGHFKMTNEAEYHKFGDNLVPKRIWNELYPDRLAGLHELSVLIQEGARGAPLKSKDAKRLSVVSSNKIKFGIALTYNDHHDLSVEDVDGRAPGERVSAIIDQHWQGAWDDAVRAFEMLIEKAVL